MIAIPRLPARNDNAFRWSGLDSRFPIPDSRPSLSSVAIRALPLLLGAVHRKYVRRNERKARDQAFLEFRLRHVGLDTDFLAKDAADERVGDVANHERHAARLELVHSHAGEHHI